MSKIKQLISRILFSLGYEIHKIYLLSADYIEEMKKTDLSAGLSEKKIHYGCGAILMPGWVNADMNPKIDENHVSVSFNAAGPHPFPSDSFDFAYAEDFLEHLSQDDSLIFLFEAFRVLREGGVLRLSFPGLEQVLAKHYPSGDFDTVYRAKIEAYSQLGHFHFYSREELKTVSEFIGFSKVEFAEYGESEHEELRGLETRINQRDLNTIAELTK